MVTPKQGDIILVTFDPTKGSEQAGTRPVLIISQDLHNQKQKMIFACPITSTNRNYPTHIAISGRCNNTEGFIMCEQLKAIDYEKRRVRLIGRASDELLAEVIEIIDLIIWGDND
ncbi:MAG: type II toxin-antitoxin system PemK/MazF family toxin [Firmicutes bacterium]|nr:type II toxin-antitoxin system PemK/MazF family toxin [Bacillota bacterium]